MHGVIGFEATDIGESATLDFRGGSVAVGKGLEPGRAVTIRADSMTILELSNLRIGPLGLPVYVDSTGRSVVAKLARRELVIEGMTRHLGLVNRLTRIFSVR